MNDNVFREIDEELRRDRLLALWKQYGRFAIGGVVALVAIVAMKVGWGEYSQHQALKAGMRYHAATELLRQGNEEAARAAFAFLAEDGGEGYAVLARLHEAALASSGGDIAGAIRLYGEIADDDDVPAAFRDLARILGAFRRVDREDPETLVEELAPLTAAENPWRHSALEITALVAIRTGETAKAREIYENLAADPKAPEMLGQRAKEMATALGEKS